MNWKLHCVPHHILGTHFTKPKADNPNRILSIFLPLNDDDNPNPFLSPYIPNFNGNTDEHFPLQGSQMRNHTKKLTNERSAVDHACARSVGPYPFTVVSPYCNASKRRLSAFVYDFLSWKPCGVVKRCSVPVRQCLMVTFPTFISYKPSGGEESLNTIRTTGVLCFYSN